MWNFYGYTITSGSIMYVALQFIFVYRAGVKGGSGVFQLLWKQRTVCSNKIKYHVQYTWTYTVGKEFITVYNMVAAAVVCFRFSRLGSCWSWIAFQRPCEVVQVWSTPQRSFLHLPASTAFWIIHFLPWIITLPERSVSAAHSDPSANPVVW